jgi:2-octaprenyl-6-methoxyphenol hydroxylase
MSQPNRAKASRSADIVIVGGGLAGLLASCRLAETGRSVVVLAPPRRPDGRTTALLGSSIDALKVAGVWDGVEDLSQPLRSIRIIDATARLVRAPEVRFDAAEMDREAFGHNIPNEPLLTALEQAADHAGVTRIAAKAEAIHRNADDVRVDTEDGETIEACLLVAADGQNSRCRSAAGIGMTFSAVGQTALVCNFVHSLPHDDISTEFHTETGPFTLVPLADKRSALVWVTSSAEAQLLVRMTPETLSEALERESHALLGQIHVEGAAQLFPLRSGVAERLSGERLVLIGEAGHVLPPIAAQGFNLTVRDIEALAGLISENADDCGAARVTDEFDRRRRGDIELRLQAVNLINRSLLSDLLPAQLARGIGLFALSQSAPLRRLAMGLGLGT